MKVSKCKSCGKFLTVKCKKCGHEWDPRVEDVITCPKCQSPRWDKPRKEKAKKE